MNQRAMHETNNRSSNRRRATRSANAPNRRPPRSNKRGYKGVSLHRKSGLWHARIRKDGQIYDLGSFATPQEAHAAYAAAAQDLFGEVARAE